MNRYATLLRRPGVAGFVGPAAIARLGVAMTGLGLLFAIRHATGSYSSAGAATGLFALMEAVVGPQLARAIDRWGQAAAVSAAVAVHVSAIATLLLLVGRSPDVLTLAVSALAGASVPQPGALAAARWAARLSDAGELRTAFALEAAVNDVAFLAGPMVVVALITEVAWWSGSVAAATLVMIGCRMLTAHHSSAPPAAERLPRRRADGVRLFTGGFIRILGVNFGLSCFFGAVPIITSAVAASHGVAALTGALLALSSAASIVSGISYGSRRRSARPTTVQLVATASLVGGVSVGALLPGVAGVAAMLIVGGAAIAPLVASTSQLVQATAPATHVTQGFTWVNTASAAGIASSAALTGVLVSQFGPSAACFALIPLVLTALVCAAIPARAR